MRIILERKPQSISAFHHGVREKFYILPQTPSFRDHFYLFSKRLFDISISFFLVPVLVGISLVLLMLNPFWNRGSLFYTQMRVGKGGREFPMLKFRSMSPKGHGLRSANDPLEKSRITPLGRWLRDYKIDELPQIFNVLLGHMSLIGPRPEISSFVQTYKREIPGYALRETFRPGMTGYAQVTQGYTDSIEMVRRKTKLDMFYIHNAGWRLDLFVLLATVQVVISPDRKPGSGRQSAQQDAVWIEESGDDDIGRSCRSL